MTILIELYLYIPNSISPTPAPINNNLRNEISSAKLINPILIVVIKITGPTTANNALIAKAFRTSLNSNMAIAADNSINAEIIRNPAIEATLVSSNESQRFKSVSPLLFVHLLKMYDKSGVLD